MSLVINDLANAINTAINPKDAHGNPTITTDQMKTYAKAIVDTLKAGVLGNAPGTINGTGIITDDGPDSGKFENGVGIGGLVVLTPTAWTSDMASGFPGANPSMLSGESAESIAYLQTSTLVSFATNKITGNCTASSTSPGSLINGVGSNGTISGLIGSAWTTAIHSTFPNANVTLTKNVYNAIVSYIQSNAVAAYASNTITGGFSAGGGALIGGTGVGGTIS